MQAKNIYIRFFKEAVRNNGYRSNQEFMEELYLALDALLLMTIEMKADLGISLEMMRVRGLSVTYEEIQQYFYPQEMGGFEVYRMVMAELRQLIHTHITGRIVLTAGDVQLSLLTISRQEELSQWHVFCLLVGSACAADRKYERIFSYLQDNNQAVYATKGLVMMLYQLTGGMTVSEYTELMVGSEFLEQFFMKNQSQWEQISFMGMPITVKPRITAYLYGDSTMPLRLSPYVTLYHGEAAPPAVLLYQQEQQQLFRLIQEYIQGDVMSIILHGKAGSGRKLLVHNLAFKQQKAVLFVETSLLQKAETVEELMADINLELMLQNAYLCLCDCSLPKWQGRETEAKEEGTEALTRIIQYYIGVCRTGRKPLLLTSQDSIARIVSTCSNKIADYGDTMENVTTSNQQILHTKARASGKVIELTLGLPNTQEKIRLWQHFLAADKEAVMIDAVALGNKYLLNAGEIQQVLESAALYAASIGRTKLQQQDILYAMKQHNSNVLGPYAERIEAVYTWEDLIVEAEVQKQLKYICNRLRYRNIVEYEWGFGEKTPYGKGTCALFYGTSGTGKTMAVQVLANDLGLELYQVDLSRMLSKYIGETQKHISELFERAKNINALLFFDEADAFFSKRTEVSDSNDKNANAEVAHLLQKLEAYEGISVLATNLKENIDDAFKRRIKYMVHFQLPDAATRQLLWDKAFPKKAPAEVDLALDYFAEHFELSGSEIKECMIHAAYMAAQEHSAIGNRHVIEALRLCFAKYGKLLGEDEFGYLV